MSWLLAQADARRIPLPDGSVSCCVTSPPYFGLRDYGTGRWEGGSEACDHVDPGTNRGRREELPNPPAAWAERAQGTPYRDLCGKCGARRVDRQLGLEPTPAAYVAAMVRVFREVKRVLHPSGTAWLNIGDSYARNGGEAGGGNRELLHMEGKQRRMCSIPDKSIKPKDMIGIPWMLAFALRDDGWYLRSEIIWAKANPMPESVTDRPAKSHEQVFLLAKSEQYYYDCEAVREDAKYGRCGWDNRQWNDGDWRSVAGAGRKGGNNCKSTDPEAGRNLRSVWTIPTESYAGAHYATFPRRLVEPCVKAGSSQRGVCPRCSAPWERVVERGELVPSGHPGRSRKGTAGNCNNFDSQGFIGKYERSTLSWRPTCRHAHDPVPATILDPFAGSATTGVVATALGRRFVGLDLSRDYLVNQARRRLERPHGPPVRPAREEWHPLFDGGEPC